MTVRKINKGNKYYQFLLSVIKHTNKNSNGWFRKCSHKVIEKIFLYCVNNTGDFADDDAFKGIYLSEAGLDETEISLFTKYNGSKIDTTADGRVFILEEFSEKIRDLCISYEREQNGLDDSNHESRDFTYSNVDELDDNLLLPKSNFGYTDILMNFFYNEEVEYKFINREPTELKFNSFLQVCKFEVINTGARKIVPIKYKVKCTAQTPIGECGNIVHFCDVHRNSSIKCGDSIGMPNGHQVKNLDSVKPIQCKELYHYLGTDMLCSDSDQKNIYSLVPINDRVVTCNCVFVNDKNDSYVVVISVLEEKVTNELDNPILLHDKENVCFLEDIFQSIKKYYGDVHGVKVINQNKIIAKIIVFQLLSNIFGGKIFNSFFMGKSGCLPKGTLVKTVDGFLPIENVKDNVLSYNFEKKCVENKPVKLFDSGVKRIYNINTPYGCIKCSSEHKWIVKRDDKIQEIITKDLLVTDKLIKIKKETFI